MAIAKGGLGSGVASVNTSPDREDCPPALGAAAAPAALGPSRCASLSRSLTMPLTVDSAMPMTVDPGLFIWMEEEEEESKTHTHTHTHTLLGNYYVIE